jgi:hypothetical protein
MSWYSDAALHRIEAMSLQAQQNWVSQPGTMVLEDHAHAGMCKTAAFPPTISYIDKQGLPARTPCATPTYPHAHFHALQPTPSLMQSLNRSRTPVFCLSRKCRK